MNEGLKFHLTKHCYIRLSERNLNAEDVKAVVRSSSDVKHLKTGMHGGKLSRFRKTADGKTLVVVAEIRHKECWVATAYYE
jgi:hypothetical protein